jgi:Short C-terminal domain
MYGMFVARCSDPVLLYDVRRSGSLAATSGNSRQVGGVMAKKSYTYKDGWPLMQPLGPKEAQLLKQNVAPGEQVLGQVIGNFNQAVIATSHKVLIVKHGLMAGQTFGGKATSYDYRNIMGVEVRTGFGQGEFEVIVAGLPTPRGTRNKDKVKATESPNAIVFPKTEQKYFQSMATQIRLMLSQPVAVSSNRTSQEVPIPEQIRQLAELHAAGILTDAEFTEKKGDLLRRI